MSPKKTKNMNIHDTSRQVPSSYLRDFSTHYRKYVANKSDENLALVHRTVSVLSTTSSSVFNPSELETAHFYVNLHALIRELIGNENDMLWTCIALLQNCCKNPEARTAMMKNYRFVPLLTNVLSRMPLLSDKASRLLNLLQDLTYGIEITWQEPYIVVLLEALAKIIFTAADEDDEKQVLLALSIIINICNKNQPVILLFMRTIKCISEFSRKIKRYGPLASKLLIILSEDLHTPEQNELNLLLRSTFLSMQKCIKDCDVAQLHQMVDFLLNSEAHFGLHNAMLSYTNYCEDIERLLGPLENNASMTDTVEENSKKRQMCLSSIFKQILYVLQLSAIQDQDGNENIISLDAITPRIFDLVCRWLESDICGTAAVQLLDGLINLSKAGTITTRIARDPTIISQLITLTEIPDTIGEHTIAILQLLLSLLQQSKTEKLILSKISESYFDKMLAPLLNTAPITISIQEIGKSIFCLQLLINFANIAKKAYFEKCCTILQMSQIQNALAYATLNGNEAICEAVFKIAQFEHFPRLAVSKQIAILNASSKSTIKTKSSTSAIGLENFPDLSDLLKTDKQILSIQTEERLVALIETISLAQRQNQLNNVSTTQIIELYNQEIDRHNCMKRSMQRSLDHASEEKTELLQHVNLQDAELQKYRNFNFELNNKIESLEAQCQDLITQRENFKRNYTNLMKKKSEDLQKLQISEKRLSVKVSELIALQKEHTELQAESKENISKIDKMKKLISNIENDIKEKTRKLDEREKELSQIKEAKVKADGLISVLEQQIQEKNEDLRNYERELTETEELRKTIMSLMESKKPKRKT